MFGEIKEIGVFLIFSERIYKVFFVNSVATQKTCNGNNVYNVFSKSYSLVST